MWYVVLMPFTHFLFPIVFFFKALISHIFVIPLLLMIRIAIFGLVYVPLTPILKLARINYDKNVPVEVSLFRLLRDASPHIGFFLISLLHYVMISIFVGTFVGLVAGLNIALVVRIVMFPTTKSTASKTTQTTPYVSAIERKLANYNQRVPKLETMKSEEKEPVKIEHRKDVGVGLSPLPLPPPLDPILSNSPVIKKEESYQFKPVFKPNTMELYEDDDGYSYMTYDSLDHVPLVAKVDTETKEGPSSADQVMYEDDNGYSYMTNDPHNPLPLVIPEEDREDTIDEETDSETYASVDSVAPDTIASSTLTSEFTSVAEPPVLDVTSEGEYEEHETDFNQKQS